MTANRNQEPPAVHVDGAAEIWYVARGERQDGPFSLETLRGQRAAGALQSDDLVWGPPLERWVPAADLFAAASEPAPGESTAAAASDPPTPAEPVRPLSPHTGSPRGEPATLEPKAQPREASAPPGKTNDEPAAPAAAVTPAVPVAPVDRQRRLGRISAIVYGGLVAVLISLSLASCFQFLDEGSARNEIFAAKDTDAAHALVLAVQIVETNLAREQMRLYVAPKLIGALAQGSPRLPARDIELSLATVNGPKLVALKRGHHLEPFDIDIPLSDGHLQLYPMDRYQGWVEAEALTAGSDATPGAKVPVVIEFNPRNHVVHVAPSPERQSEAGDVVVRLSVSRLLPIVMFTWFMAGVASVISLTVVLVVITVVTGRRRAELGMLGWTTALLFALPAVRNNLPGAPPLGALIDYSAFFWAEALVGLSMLVLVGFWFVTREENG